MEQGGKPRWTTTATVGLVVLILLFIIGISFVSSLFPKKDNSVTPQVSQVAFSLTEAQQKEIMLLVSPLIQFNAVDFHSIDEADPNLLTDGTILHLLRSNKTFRLDESGMLYISESDVAAAYEHHFNAIPDFSEYQSENFMYNAALQAFFVQTDILGSADSEPTFVTAPESLFPQDFELSIMSASVSDKTVSVTLSAVGEETHKYEVTLSDDGDYVLLSFLEI